MHTREFDVSVILSVITAQILSPADQKGIDEIMQYLYSKVSATVWVACVHKPSLARCGDSLLAQFSQFRSTTFRKEMEAFTTLLAQTESLEIRRYIKHEWVTAQKVKFGNTLAVRPM